MLRQFTNAVCDISNMTFELLPSLPDALRILSESTGTTWTRAKFFKTVVDHSLPLLATTPNDSWPVIYSMGEQRNPGIPELGYRRHALLAGNAIRNLAMHGEACTSDVALEPGDPDFITWPAIKARRLERELELKQRAYTAEEWDALPPWSRWLPADFMGESDVYTLSEEVTVTDDTCRVPAETIEELLAMVANTSNKPVADSPPFVLAKKYRTRRNSLDAPIEKALKAAGSMSSSDVWVHLREHALQGEPPFTGQVEGNKLYYTNDHNEVAILNKEALKKRMERLRKAAPD